ncbi:MFS transporter, DHA2 family, lincomycin resistance protein [Ligilactobacillus sp. WC1T17]|uniref:MFS transporter, DHA2 family, lincomycin resistance protein n=1 Tax=Ligilactobacillus ruminis TaxID=1623 RepID=A0ABY1AC17_9LACO|nr:MFS transporter, DHA2 family, lincomycin resistance protein [Ligilactobacillus ruminis]
MENATVKPMKAVVEVNHPWLAMSSMLIGAFVGMLSETSLNIALPTLGKYFGVETGTLQWLVTGYMLVIGIVLPFSSLISKWFTTKQIITFALADFIVGSLISGFANSFAMLLFGRMVQGIGTGLILPLMFTVAMLIFPPNKIGTAMGINALVIMFAPAIGPTLTGILLGAASWQAVFFSFAIILAIGLVLAYVGLANVSQITKPKVDLLSVLGSALGFSALVAGTSFASSQGWTSPLVLGLLAFGIIVLAFYARRQLRLAQPVLNLHVFQKPAFRTGAILVMIDFGIILSAMFLLPQFIQNAMLLPVAMTGILMLPGGVVNAVVSAFAGRLYDSFGAKVPARLGFLIAFVGAVMFAFAAKNASIGYVILAHVIMMIGCPLAMSPSQTHGLNALRGPESADGSTIMNTLQQIVGAIATALATSFLALGEASAHTADKAASFTNGVHYGFYFTAFLALLGFVISLTLHDRDKSEDVKM